MTFESMMLRSLFGACVLVCGLALAAMVTAKPVPVQLASHSATSAPLTSASANHGKTVG